MPNESNVERPLDDPFVDDGTEVDECPGRRGDRDPVASQRSGGVQIRRPVNDDTTQAVEAGPGHAQFDDGRVATEQIPEPGR